MNPTSASKSGGGRVVSQPLREQELLGLPKSTGKKGLQPVRMKDILGPVEWEKARQSGHARRTIMPDSLNNAKRKLYETSGQQTPGVCGEDTRENGHVSGLSKSEGKVNSKGLGRIRMQPENMKHLMESWEKVQTVERPTPSAKTVEVRNQKVRRKLYNHLPFSPKPVAKNNPIGRKSEMKRQKSFIAEAKTASKSIASSRKSIASSRKSRLVQPNAIRDKHVRQQDVIAEESTLSIENGSMKSAMIESAEKINSLDEIEKEKNVQSEEIMNDLVENAKNVDSDEIDELPNSSTLQNIPNDKETLDKNKGVIVKREIVRPSVIMGVSVKELRKEQSPKSNENEKINTSNSYVFLKELNRNTSLRGENLVSMDKSLDDNPGNISYCDNGGSFYYNLPQNSFLKSTLATKNSSMYVDSQTIQWMHENLKLQVQSTEEQLFSMKRLLKTLEDLIKDEDNGGVRESKPPIESEVIFAGQIADVEPKAVEENVMNEKRGEPKAVEENVMNEKAGEPKTVEENVTNEKAGEPSEEIPTVGKGSKRIAFKVISTSTSNRGLSSDRETSPLPQNIDDRDKENKKSVEKPRRRSARLAEKMSDSPKLLTDSFSSIEKELNIVHVKTKKATPVKTKAGSTIDPRCRRSVREYMALKSSSNFLTTPDVKGCQAAIEDRRTPSKVRSTRRDLSRKLLNELEDLYADSPM